MAAIVPAYVEAAMHLPAPYLPYFNLETLGPFAVDLARSRGRYEFRVTQRTRMNIGNTQSAETLQEWHYIFSSIFAEMLDIVRRRENLSRNDKIFFQLQQPDVVSLNINFNFFGDINAERILEELIAQMYGSDFKMDLCTFMIYFSKRLVGGSGNEMRTMDLKTFASKRSIMDVYPDANECFIMCLVLGMLERKNDMTADFWKKIRAKKQKEVRIRCLAVDLSEEHVHWLDGVPFDDISLYEDAYKVGITVVGFPSLSIMRYGKKDLELGQIWMIFVEPAAGEREGHFLYVRKGCEHNIWPNRVMWCQICLRSFSTLKHKCINTCPGCNLKACEGAGKTFEDLTHHCLKCNRKTYDSDFCKKKHPCKTLKTCKTCNVPFIVVKHKPHKCGHGYCKNCEMQPPLDEPHYCYHLPDTVDDENEEEELEDKSLRCVYYDIESMFGENRQHIFAGAIAIYEDSNQVYEFKTLDEFGDWIFKEEHANTTFIAHNGAKYDFHFVKKYMLDRAILSNDIVGGNSYTYSAITRKEFRFKGLRFIDSYKFIMVPLRKFPKTFDLQDVGKTYFPYRFFTTERQFYVGPLPDRTWFESSDEAFEEWYQSQPEVVDLYRMAMDYCIEDVRLLKAGCQAFRKTMKEATTMDPFSKVTIAGFCHQVYRQFYMPPKSIAVLHHPDERVEHLEYFECNILIPHPHPYVTGQHLTGPLHVFAYCFETGCKTCFKRYTIHPIKCDTMRGLHTKHQEQLKALRDQGHEVVVRRQCTWRKMKRLDRQVRWNMRTLQLPKDKLVIKDAFFGGRTEVFKQYATGKLSYFDFTSLYPSVNFGQVRGVTPDTYDQIIEFPYPVGHPVVITENFKDLSEYFGFVLCKIAPPKDLLIPLLPSRGGGKLVFDLKDKVGTWTTIEVLKAIELGYVVEKIYEVFHFEQTTTDLFKDYVKVFYKMKIEAGGFSKVECFTREEKQAFVDMIQREMGIELDSMSDEYNAGRYFISKLCLNSLWGKFGQRNNFTSTTDTFSRKEFEDIVYSDQYDVSGVVMHTDLVRLGNEACTRSLTRERLSFWAYRTRPMWLLRLLLLLMHVYVFTQPWKRWVERIWCIVIRIRLSLKIMVSWLLDLY
jgi:hypothetical protein